MLIRLLFCIITLISFDCCVITHVSGQKLDALAMKRGPSQTSAFVTPSVAIRSRKGRKNDILLRDMGNSSIKMDMEEFLNLSVQDGRVGNSTSENRMCVFNMNQPLQVKDNNLIGITLLPVRSYFFEIAIYPLAVVDQATNILELRSDNLQVPAMGFLPNSTQLVVSLSISSKETLDIVSLQPLQLESWSIVSFDIVGNKATLEILSSISPQFSFKQEIILPQKRSLVTSVSIYGASPSWPAAADAFINGLKVCLPTFPPAATLTEGPSASPTVAPTQAATHPPTTLRSEKPTSLPTPAYTIFVPSPTSVPTSTPTSLL